MIAARVMLIGIAVMAMFSSAAADEPAAPQTARIVLKFVKAAGQANASVAFMPDSCQTCQVGQDSGYSADNIRESIVEVIVPLSRTLELRFASKPGAIRRVILETGDLPFVSRGGELSITLPPVTADAITAAEFATHIVEPGMVLRFEHADPARRAGAYAVDPFPEVQHRAAGVLTFAQREVIRETGLGAYVDAEKIGMIQVMGFDTNFPHAHRDAPPHMHMHLRWPRYAGTQIAHYYIDDHGLLDRNTVGLQLLRQRERLYGKGETFTTIDMFGRPVYRHMITAQGWLELGRADLPPCLIKPIKGGFDSGATVSCPGDKPRRITVKDDPSGTLVVTTNDIVETFHYDLDTGTLLSPTKPPPVPASGYPPSIEY